MIARKSSIIFANTILSGLLGYVGLYFVAHYMGPTPLGIIGFGMGFLGIFSFITDLGFNTAHIKLASEKRDLGRCISTYLTIKIIMVMILILAVLGGISTWKYFFHGEFESPIHERVVYLLLFYFVFNNLSLVALNTLGAKTETAKQQIPNFLGTITQVVAMTVVALASLGAILLAGAYVLGSLVTLIASIMVLRKYPVGKLTKEYLEEYTKFALPLAFAASIGLILSNMDKVMIQMFWSSNEVGYYYTTQKIVQYFDTLSGSVGWLLLPTMSLYYSKNKWDEIRKLTILSERYISMILLPCIIFIIIFADIIISLLLGDQFIPAINILRVLAIVGFISSLNRPHVYALIGISRPGLIARLTIFTLSLNTLLNLLFIPTQLFGIRLLGMGAIGSALATFISVSLGFILLRYFTHKTIETPVNYHLFKQVIAGVVMGTSVYGICTMIHVYWWHLPFLGVIGLCTYALILHMLGEFSREDITFFIDTLNLAETKKYLESEIRGI